MDVIINENQINVPVEISTWGDLLDWIETDHLRAGECITHVYLGGNEAMNYRDTMVCRREIIDVGSVAIKSGNFDRVVRESMAELDQELHAALESAGEIVRLLENRNEQEAYSRLAELLDSIRIFFTIFSEDLGWADLPHVAIFSKEFPAAL